MVDNDIYDNQKKYEYFKEHLQDFLNKPEKGKDSRRKYYCKNPENLQYFQTLFQFFEAKDLSFVRRCRLLGSFRLACYATEKDLGQCTREDLDKIMIFMHTVYKSPKSKRDFAIDIRFLFKILFPELDEKGRVDSTLTPYVVRHLSGKMDKSREKRREDKFSYNEFETIVNFFGSDPRMQFFLMVSLESLGRPQELLWTRIKDLEIYDNYAKLWISSHGKEGTGFLQIIDSFPYLTKWLSKHPLKAPENFLFCNLEGKVGSQLKPKNINNKLKSACKALGINKPITCYSIKRNGVTLRRLRGDSDVQIQHTARWSSTKQLKIYDLSERDETFKQELIKRGLITADENNKHLEPKTKKCIFCFSLNGFTEITCVNCLRPLDRKKIEEQEVNREAEFSQFREEIGALKNFFNPQAMQELFKTVYLLQKQMEEVRKK